VADPYDGRDFEPDGRSFAPRPTRRRALVRLGSFAALVVIAISGGYVWRTYDHPVERGRYAPALDAQVAATLQELRARQVQSAKKIEEIDRSMVAAQVDLKKLSDELSSLETRMRGLQNVWNPLAPEPDVGAQPIIPPSRKPSDTPKAADPTSLGGAPVNAPAPDQGARK